MRILNFFRNSRKSATIAKERLQIIVSHESADKNKDFIRDLQQELLDVISKYVDIDREQIRVQLEQSGDHSVLELNVTLPEQPKKMLSRAEREEALSTAE